MGEHVRLGELLVDAKAISRQTLEEALERQKTDGRRLGVLLAEAGVVTETQVTQILSQQLSVPWVSLYHIDFSRQLLDLVPREVAERYCLVPIFVRRTRGGAETLYVAMDDPTDERAREEVAHFAGLPVRAMIAAPSDIVAAIRAYYGRPSLGPGPASGATSAGELPPATAARPPAPAPLPAAGAAVGPAGPGAPAAAPPDVAGDAPSPAASPPRPAAARGSAPAAPGASPRSGPGAAPAAAPSPARSGPVAGTVEEPEPDSGVPVSARESSMPRPRHGARKRMITLTLLDGTHVTLPARGPSEPPASEAEGVVADALTARDLVSALRAAAHGADATEVLGDATRWEPLFAALLSLLLRKHLIADWEFVAELERVKKR